MLVSTASYAGEKKLEHAHPKSCVRVCVCVCVCARMHTASWLAFAPRDFEEEIYGVFLIKDSVNVRAAFD